jgi:hypothetical protein
MKCLLFYLQITLKMKQLNVKKLLLIHFILWSHIKNDFFGVFFLF